MNGNSGIWVFGYGSLMWRPDFPYMEACPALLYGYRRALCIYSVFYRGTPECPGLVLGLDRGGSCRGRVFRVADADADHVIAKLDERELINDVYTRKTLKTRLDDGRTVAAQAYVARPEHKQYAGGLSPERTVQIICQGHGKEGSSLDYLKNTVQHLDQMGIKDGPLHVLLETVEGG